MDMLDAVRLLERARRVFTRVASIAIVLDGRRIPGWRTMGFIHGEFILLCSCFFKSVLISC